MLPMRIPLLLGLATVFAGPAFAQTSYNLAVTGQVDHTVNCWETTPMCSGPPHDFTPWVGTLTIVLDSAADGVYQGPDLESLSLVANVGSFAPITYDNDPSFEVTITGGKVSSVDAEVLVDSSLDTSAFDLFSGLTANYNGSGGTHYGPTIASGALAPIPEPAEATLLLGGLAGLVAWSRRRQACASGQRGLTSNA